MGYAHEQVLRGHSDEVYSVVFSPDGSHVASGRQHHMYLECRDK